jgi:hypothetical protein
MTGQRVALADIEANISNEFYFTAEDGVVGFHVRKNQGAVGHSAKPHSLSMLTICVLVLANGFTVTGESACADPAIFNAETGRGIARANAISKIWPLMGYELRTKLAGQRACLD